MSDRRYTDLYCQIEGFPGYAVSIWGEVFSPRRRLPLRGSRTNGYVHVGLYAACGKRKNARVHRLVLEAFAGPCPEGMEARHLNGMRDDNRLVNLEWATHEANCADKALHGTSQVGARNGKSKLTEGNVHQIKLLLLAEQSQEDIATKFGVSRAAIGHIKTGRTWSHV